MNGPCRTGMAAALALVLCCVGPWPASAADRPAVIVDLSVLDSLDAADGPGWVPPLPGRRPSPPILPARRIGAEPAEAPLPPPASTVVPATRLAPAAPLPPIVRTAPVLWQRPIPVTASALLLQQVGARSTAPTPSSSENLVDAAVEFVDRADLISAVPIDNGVRLLFVDDRTALGETGERLLDTLAARMEARTDLRLSVLAYAGGTPDTASRSRLLSLQRGLAVRNYLFDRGVRGSRIDIRALGNTFADGPAERVDLLLTE